MLMTYSFILKQSVKCMETIIGVPHQAFTLYTVCKDTIFIYSSSISGYSDWLNNRPIRGQSIFYLVIQYNTISLFQGTLILSLHDTSLNMHENDTKYYLFVILQIHVVYHLNMW